MNITEKVMEMHENGTLDPIIGQHTAKEVYLEMEGKLVDAYAPNLIGQEVTCVTYGDGKVTAVSGKTLDSVILEITFGETVKNFSLQHVMTNKFIQFVNSEEVAEAWNTVFEAHTNLTDSYRESDRTFRQMQKDAEKKAEADKKAEARYQKQKEQAVKSFDEMVQQAGTALSEVDEFYYALGWLANHVGSMTAILPDYLGSAFEKHFGSETPKTLVDGRAKTSGGHAKQWSWEFRCTIKKLKETVVPSCIQSVTTDFSKGIHNTAFLWDLVTNYGFQFGKKQDVDKIKSTIPAKYISSFEAGLTA